MFTVYLNNLTEMYRVFWKDLAYSKKYDIIHFEQQERWYAVLFNVFFSVVLLTHFQKRFSVKHSLLKQ